MPTGLQNALAFTLAAAAGLIVTSVVLAAGGRRLRPGERPLERERMRDFVLWGLLYCNPDDPRGWVPKTRGPGYTVNVRTRGAAFLMLAFTLATAAGVILTLLECRGLLPR